MERRLNLHPRARFYLVRFVSRPPPPPPNLARGVVCTVVTQQTCFHAFIVVTLDVAVGLWASVPLI